MTNRPRLRPLLALSAAVLCAAAASCSTATVEDERDSDTPPERDVVGANDIGAIDEDRWVEDERWTDEDIAPDAPVADTDPPDTGEVGPADTAPDAPTVDTCGDGTLDPDEGCDDGNTRAGDGCGPSCKREVEFLCEPCGDDGACGGADDLCIDGACAADCSDWPCPTGSTCREITNRRVIAHQCVPDDGCGARDEICDNGGDEDRDGRVDCDDSDCADAANCRVVGGPGSCDEPEVASLGRNTATPRQDIRTPSCLSIADEEVVFAFRPHEATTFCLDTRGSQARDTVISVRGACADADTELLCIDDVTDSTVEFQAYGQWTAGSTTRVFVIVDVYGRSGSESVRLTISEGACDVPPPPPARLGAITCLDSVVDVANSGVPGDRYRVTCPSGCSSESYLFGTDVYSDDSLICLAAIHAGVLSASGGDAIVTIEPGRGSYTGSTRNGITSLDWSGGGDRSFGVESP